MPNYYDKKIKKISIYVGYDNNGQQIIDFLHQKAKELNTPISTLVIDLLRNKFPDLPKN